MLYLQCFRKDSKRLKRAKVNILFSTMYQFFRTIFVNNPVFTANHENEVQKHLKLRCFDENMYKFVAEFITVKTGTLTFR